MLENSIFELTNFLVWYVDPPIYPYNPPQTKNNMFSNLMQS